MSTQIVPFVSTAPARNNNCETSQLSEPATGAPQPPVQHPERRATLAASRNVVELRRSSFLAAWSCVVGLHTVCAVYLTQFARVCLFLSQPYMAYWTQLAAGNRRDYFWSAGVVLGVMSALHWWQLACILWFSLRSRELVLLDRAFKVPTPCAASYPTTQEQGTGIKSHPVVSDPG